MKILLVGDWPPPYGGVAVHMQQLHAFLEERGVDVRVLDIGENGEGRQPARFVTELARHAGKGYAAHLHTSGNNRKAWVVAAAVGPMRPSIITVHSGLFPEFVEASATNRTLVRAALARYAAVIAVSEPVREALLRCRYAPERISVQPAFLSSQVRPGRAPAGFDAVRARRRPLIAMADHPSPVYGTERMLLALRLLRLRFPDIGLALFGPGDKPRGCDGLVEWLGELPHDEALAVIERSDVFVRPTTHDGDAISVREALALGTPCVASDVAPRPAGTIVYADGGLIDAITTAVIAPRPRPSSADCGPYLLSLYQRLMAPEAVLHATT